MSALDDMFNDLPHPIVEADADTRQMAQTMWTQYQAFKNVGFSESQAFDFVHDILITYMEKPGDDE